MTRCRPVLVPMTSLRFAMLLVVGGCIALASGAIASGGPTPAAPGPEATTEPVLELAGWSIDTTSGNLDAGVQPGETVRVFLWLANRGGIATGVVGELREAVDHPDVTILDKLATWPDLRSQVSAAPSSYPGFTLQVGANRPCNWVIPLRLDVAASGYSRTFDLEITLTDPQTYDLEGGARPFYFGAEPGDGLGAAIAAGDFDNDGYLDLAFGAPDADGPANARPDAGEVVLVYGSADRPADIDFSYAPGTITIFGADTGDRLGKALAAGDFNGDGIDDLFIGAPHGNGSANALPDAGEVYIIHGWVRRSVDLDLASAGSDPLVGWVYGARAGDTFGDALAVGDIDADGRGDLIGATPGASGPSPYARSAAGGAVVVYGPAVRPYRADLANLPTVADALFLHGADSFDGAAATGTRVASGDLDGDGFDDIILGAAGADGRDNLAPDAGEVAVIHGGPLRVPSLDLAAPIPGMTFVYGALQSDGAGTSVATGDLDGDGLDELLIGVPNGNGPSSYGGLNDYQSGQVAVVYGDAARFLPIDLASPLRPVATVYGRFYQTRMGLSVAAGDLDGDGYDDLIAGGRDQGQGAARADAGIIDVVHGGPVRWDGVSLKFAPAMGRRIDGAEAGDKYAHLPGSLIAADLDRDGLLDIVAGGTGGDGPRFTGRSLAGEAAVVPGEPRSRYRWDTATFSWIDTSGGADIGLICDDCAATIPIGFGFDYFGRRHTSVTVSSNGYLTFTGDGDALPSGCLPSPTPPDDIIAVFWQDFDLSAGGAVRSLLQGTAPNRRLTIEWNAVRSYGDTGDATFEVTLFESSDQVVMQYLDTYVDPSNAYGSQGIAGVENATGKVGTFKNCFASGGAGWISPGTAYRFRRFGNPTVVWSEPVNAVFSGWNLTGLWHPSVDGACGEMARTGGQGLYYGYDFMCFYDTSGLPNAGTMTSPVIPALPQDATLSFWQRRMTEVNPQYDLSTVLVSTGGGPFGALGAFSQVTDRSGTWRFSDDIFAALGTAPASGQFRPYDLSALAGDDIQLQFSFDTGAPAVPDNFWLGWVLDDMEIRACPVQGGGGGAGGFATSTEARATAQPQAICQTSSGTVDAVGSYCAACTDPLTYQWKENGAPLGGATGIAYTIAPNHPAGTFAYSVAVACPSNPACADESNVAQVTVVVPAQAVGATLTVARAGADLTFHWGDVPGAEDYVLLSDTAPDGAFTTEVATSVSGAAGITTPLPPGSAVFYKIAGRNPVCGQGPAD